MSARNLANPATARQYGLEHFASLGARITIGAVARALRMTREGVRYLVRADQLRCERTPTKLRLFQVVDVVRLEAQRTQARIAGRLPIRRPLGPRGQPRQMLLPGTHLRLIHRRRPGDPTTWQRSSKPRANVRESA